MTRISGYLSAIVCVFLLGIVNPPTAFSQTDLLKSSLHKKLDSLIEVHQVPGATLSAYWGEEKKMDIKAGYADPELGIQMPLEGQMLLGSTGKTFVAATLLQLVSKGQLELDQKLLHYFPENKWMLRLPEAKKLTLRMLLTHTSGMPRYIFQPEFLEALKADRFATRSPEECISFVLDKKPAHAAGEGWSYSDTNYLLLGMLIEKITGEKYYELVQKNLLNRFELTQTYPSTQPELPGLVQGHIGTQNFFELPQKVINEGKYALNPQFEWTGGGWVSNASDLAKWMYLLHSGKVITEEMHDEMLKVVDFRTGKPSEAGYGFANFTWKDNDITSYGHAGMMPGYLTQIEYYPKGKFGIAIQINTDENPTGSLHAWIRELAPLIHEYILSE